MEQKIIKIDEGFTSCNFRWNQNANIRMRIEKLEIKILQRGNLHEREKRTPCHIWYDN